MPPLNHARTVLEGASQAQSFAVAQSGSRLSIAGRRVAILGIEKEASVNAGLFGVKQRCSISAAICLPAGANHQQQHQYAGQH